MKIKFSSVKKTALLVSILLTISIIMSACNSDDTKSISDTSESNPEVSILITEKTIPITKENVKFIGRVAQGENDLWYMDWTNTGIEFTFTGTDAYLEMGPVNAAANNNPCYLVYVDDGEPRRIDELTSFNKQVLAQSLPFGEHTIKVIKVTESTGTPVAMKDITIYSSEPKEPQLLQAPAASKRKILFFGDSITAGYGNLGKPDNKNFYTYEQDGTQTYAALAADSFSADAHFVCISGRGVYQSLDGSFDNVIPSYINTAVPSLNLAWDSSDFTPDLIVVNLGTNDAWMSVTADKFTEAARKFLINLRETYPDSKILWCFGMMGNYYDGHLSKLIEEFNTEYGNAYFLVLETVSVFSEEEGGANGHPNVLAHQKRAISLREKIAEIMGWD